jgi:GPH family glycoside/pentoside/hexuronide:cation symporter
VAIADRRALSALQLLLFVGALIGVPFWLRIARAIEKHWLYLGGAAGLALLLLGAFALLGHGRPFGTGDVRPLLVGQTLAGFVVALFWIMPASMLADVADEDALTTGQRRDGTFFGIFSFGQQLATGVSVLIAGLLVDPFAGLAPGQASPSTVTVERIGMLYSLLLGLALMMLRYPLDSQRVAAIQLALAARPGQAQSRVVY